VNELSKSELSRIIKKTALDIGFSFCGISRAEFLEEDAGRLHRWLERGFHGEMEYMANNRDKRTDPRLMVENAHSVISLLYNYSPEEEIPAKKNFRISKYAYGTDYHFVIKKKLHQLVTEIKKSAGDFSSRVFVDSAPVLEKTWAQKAGLGWIGKNTCLINREMGSYLFIAEIITSLQPDYDQPFEELCGTCTRCLDACPTGALVAPFLLDANKCISYLTIEFKNDLTPDLKDKFQGWIFGCDICQDVCPWNRFKKPHNEPAFSSPDQMVKMRKKDWINLDEENFRKIFKNSAVKRTKYKGLRRNIDYLADED